MEPTIKILFSLALFFNCLTKLPFRDSEIENNSLLDCDGGEKDIWNSGKQIIFASFFADCSICFKEKARFSSLSGDDFIWTIETLTIIVQECCEV